MEKELLVYPVQIIRHLYCCASYLQIIVESKERSSKALKFNETLGTITVIDKSLPFIFLCDTYSVVRNSWFTFFQLPTKFFWRTFNKTNWPQYLYQRAIVPSTSSNFISFYIFNFDTCFSCVKASFYWLRRCFRQNDVQD